MLSMGKMLAHMKDETKEKNRNEQNQLNQQKKLVNKQTEFSSL